MANNPLDELVQTSSNPVAGQPGLADVGNPSISPVPSSVAPDMPSQSDTVSSSTPPTTQADNPLDELISGTASTPVPTNAPSDEASPLPSPLPPLDASKAEKSVLAASTATTSPSTMSAAAQAQPSIASLDNPLDSLITHESTDKQPEPDAGLQSTASQPAKEKPLSSSLDAFVQPTPQPEPTTTPLSENPIPLEVPSENISTTPLMTEHDINPSSKPIDLSKPLAVPAPPPADIAQPAPALTNTLKPSQVSEMTQAELEKKAKQLLNDSPPKDKKSKRPLIMALLTLLIVIGAAGGGLFAYRLINPESTDQRSLAAGICCMGGECNDGTTFGGDPSAWHSSCDVRAAEFCNAENRGGVKRSDGACTGSEPNTCNDHTPADSCWVFVCPNGCGGDGNDTSCDGGEPGAVKRIVDCNSAQLGNRECGQIDYVKNNQYCGVKLVQCGTDCSPNPSTPPNPTATPSLTPSVSPQPGIPTVTANLACTSNQTLGNLSYDIRLTNINPVSGFEQANFQLCLYPASNAGHKHIFQNFFGSNASYKDTNLVNGVPTWACYQIGPIVTQLTSTNQITHVFNRSKKLGNTAAWAKSIDEFAAFIDTESAANRINKLLQYQIKPVLQANGVKNDQFVAGMVMIHSTACVGPSPSPSPTLTPNPSAPPLACVSLTKSPATIPLGSAVTFTCNSQPNAAKYEFRYKVANGAYANLTPDASNISTTNLIITDPGSYTVECRACEDAGATKCTTWGRAK